jgi:hypothetical protein
VIATAHPAPAFLSVYKTLCTTELPFHSEL